jgi:hypothetical protein
MECTLDCDLARVEIKMFECRCCSADIHEPVFSGVLLDKTVSYFECPNCGYVQTETPTWLEQAYASPINASDTGIMARNKANLENVLATLMLLRMRRGKVIDYAGGYGLLVRMLRDVGIDACWSDPYASNLVSLGFEYSGGGGDLITTFEAFEHFVNPITEMEAMFTIAPNLLFSTELIATPSPEVNQWWYYGADHGQHIGFFRLETLQYLAKKFRKHLISDGKSLHLLTEKKSSQLEWQMWRRLVRVIPRALTLGLKSKTCSDQVFIKNKEL